MMIVPAPNHHTIQARRQRLLSDVVGAIQADGRMFDDIAKEAGVHVSTIQRWIDREKVGEYFSPWIKTLMAVVYALGYDLILVKREPLN